MARSRGRNTIRKHSFQNIIGSWYLFVTVKLLLLKINSDKLKQVIPVYWHGVRAAEERTEFVIIFKILPNSTMLLCFLNCLWKPRVRVISWMILRQYNILTRPGLYVRTFWDSEEGELNIC